MNDYFIVIVSTIRGASLDMYQSLVQSYGRKGYLTREEYNQVEQTLSTNRLRVLNL